MIDDVISLMTDDSQASTPGGVRPRYWNWVRHRPPPWLLLSVPMWVSLVVGFLIPMPELWLLTGILAPLNWFRWSRTKTHFRFGDANPGVIVSADPPLMAVATDLTRGRGDYPAVRVVRVNLKEIDGEPLRRGQRLPTVALYGAPAAEQVPYWSNFDPLPVQYADRRPKTVADVMATFEPEAWQTLKAAVNRLPRPFAAGLYLLGWDGKYTNRGRRV